jgi:hypothetical protein
MKGEHDVARITDQIDDAAIEAPDDAFISPGGKKGKPRIGPGRAFTKDVEIT